MQIESEGAELNIPREAWTHIAMENHFTLHVPNWLAAAITAFMVTMVLCAAFIVRDLADIVYYLQQMATK